MTGQAAQQRSLLMVTSLKTHTMAGLRSLTLFTLVILVSGAVGQDTREDGKCGAGNLAASGRPAKCEHM